MGDVRDALDEAGTKGLEVAFDVPVPPDALLAILWSPTHFARLFPDIEAFTVLREDGESLEVEYRIDAVVRKMRYVLRRTLDREARTISWREIGGDLRRVRGAWEIGATSDAGASRAKYAAFVDIGRLVPTSLVRDAAKRKLGEMVARVKHVAAAIHAETVSVDRARD